MELKRIFAFVLAAVMTASAAGCASSEGSSVGDESSSKVKVEKKEDKQKADDSSVEQDESKPDDTKPDASDETGEDDNSSTPELKPDVQRNESTLTFSQAGGVYGEEFELEINAESGKLYYTLDGSDPAVSGTRIEYTDKISIKSREGDANVVSAVSPTLISGNFNEINYGEGGYVCTKKAPEDSAVDKCTVVRACAEADDGTFTKTVTETYYIGTAEDHIKGLAESTEASGTSLAVISISMAYDDLFDPTYGIYVKGERFDTAFQKMLDNNELKYDGEEARQIDANYKQRGKAWERRCHINFFEMSPDGTQQTLSQDCGIRIQGNYSRSDLVKGLRLFARKDYGEKRFEYDVFHGKATDKDGENIESFKTLTLRAGGNCAFSAKFNDTYWQDMSKTLDCATKASRPCVVYINGEYWGLYVLEEDYSDDYFEDHFGVEKDNVIVYKGDAETYASGYKLDEGELPEGVNDEGYYFKELTDFFKKHKSLAAQEDYDEFAKLVDVDSVRDYFLSEVWINNKWDWPGKNWSMWKTSEVDEENEYADGRWRLMFYDMEFGGVSGVSDARTNTVKEDNYKKKGLLDMDTNNPAVLCYAYLMTNEDFRKDYNEKLLALSEGIYEKETLLAGLTQYENEYSPLYDQFFERYPDTGSKQEALTGGYSSSKCIRDFIDKRAGYIQKMIDWIEKTV